MIEPSKEWTDRERLDLITALAEELLKRSDVRALLPIGDRVQRILYAASMGKGFLESNRDYIVKGKA